MWKFLSGFFYYPRACLKTIKVTKPECRQWMWRPENRPLFVSGGEPAVIFKFEKKRFDQMALFVCVPVRFPGMFGGNAAGDDGDPAPLIHPFWRICLCRSLCPPGRSSPSSQKALTALAPCKCHCGFRQWAKSAEGSQARPSPCGLSSSARPGCVQFPHYSPLFSPTAMLVDLYGCAV